jgi:purine-binding chemotaxis protein CheW
MSLQYCTFFIGELFLGLEVMRVQEVLRECPVTPVPASSSMVRGLINLRGQIVTAVDLRNRFGLAADDLQPLATAIVLDAEDELLSLVVDRAGDVVEVDESAFESPPETLNGETRRLIRGAYKLDDRLLLVLDLERAFNLAPTVAREVEP